jgi:hypothetical protein
VIKLLLVMAVLGLAAVGCGGDDEPAEPAAEPATATTAPPSTSEAAPPATETEPEDDAAPRRRRTPASLADCLRAADGVDEVLVKGRESEDATFFSELAGGRVDVLGVTVEGEATEVTVALFETAADARSAAPGSGGGGVEARAVGSALVLAAPGAETGSVVRCLRETRYA